MLYRFFVFNYKLVESRELEAMPNFTKKLKKEYKTLKHKHKEARKKQKKEKKKAKQMAKASAGK